MLRTAGILFRVTPVVGTSHEERKIVVDELLYTSRLQSLASEPHTHFKRSSQMEDQPALLPIQAVARSGEYCSVANFDHTDWVGCHADLTCGQTRDILS